jgi:hypothetical protein
LGRGSLLFSLLPPPGSRRPPSAARAGSLPLMLPRCTRSSMPHSSIVALVHVLEHCGGLAGWPKAVKRRRYWETLQAPIRAFPNTRAQPDTHASSETHALPETIILSPTRALPDIRALPVTIALPNTSESPNTCADLYTCALPATQASPVSDRLPSLSTHPPNSPVLAYTLTSLTYLLQFGRLKKCTPLEFAGNLKVFL